MVEQAPDPNEITKEIPPEELVQTAQHPFEHPLIVENKVGTLVAATDIGFGRERNEDVVVVVPGKGFAVVDGMGGHGKGDIAAKILAAELEKALSGQQTMTEARRAASRKMKERGLKAEGACFLSVQIVGNKLLIDRAGDPRLVVLSRDGKVKFETADESAGRIVFNSVQGKSPGDKTHEEIAVAVGDRVYAASDGLWGNDDIESELKLAGTIDLVAAEALRKLYQSELEEMRSGRRKPGDNITIVIQEITNLD